MKYAVILSFLLGVVCAHSPSVIAKGPAAGWPGGPLKSIYIDDNINWNNPSVTFKSIVDSGYNLVILAFFVSGKPEDIASVWGQMSDADKQSTVSYAHSKNARIIVSGGGGTDSPYSKFTGTQFGTTLANWAKSNHLDGVDFDLENFAGGFKFGSMNTNQTISWVVDATNSARSILGADAVITHAPQPPYFGPNNGFADGYTQIYKRAPSIDFLQVQFYDNGPATTYQEIFISAGGGAVKEIASYGIPLSKIVVGKTVAKGDADQYLTAAQIHAIFEQAKSGLGWEAGVMGWEWHDATTNANWIKTIFP